MPAPFTADVIVAGAGPAGAVAARTLAAAGVRTLLVDRAAFPRNKPCGGGISTRVLSRFPWLDAALRAIDVHRIGRLYLEGPGCDALELETAQPAVLLVRRLDFDNALVRAATAAGARLETGFEITQVASNEEGVSLRSRDGRQVSAPFVIAADGVHSVIAKRTGVNSRWPRTHLAIDMMEETPSSTLSAVRPDVLWVAYAYGGLDGYAYVFPKAHHVNVGIGCLLSHFDREVTDAPYTLQEAFVRSLVGRNVLAGRSDRTCFTPFLIPVGGPLPRAVEGRVLFTGDAGGFVNAITAEGLYYAMVSGELAASAIVAAGRGGARGGSGLELTYVNSRPDPAGVQFERAWRAEIGAELSDAVLVQRHLFSSHARVRHAIAAARTMPGVTRPILQYFQGAMSYRALRRRLLMKCPLTLWRMARDQRAAMRRPAS